MSATPPITNKREHLTCRPLSAIEFIIPGNEAEDGNGKLRETRRSVANTNVGIENNAFELGSPLLSSPSCVEVTALQSAQTQGELEQLSKELSESQQPDRATLPVDADKSVSECVSCGCECPLEVVSNSEPTCDRGITRNKSKRPSRNETLDRPLKRLSHCESVDSESTLSLDASWYRDKNSSTRTRGTGRTKGVLHEQDCCGCNDCSNTAHNNKRCAERSEVAKQPARCSWTEESTSTLKNKELMANRRRTDPYCGKPKRISAYHKNYQEALSSLLWEPYDCRSPNPSTPIGASYTSWFFQKKRPSSDAYHISSSSSSSSESLISSQNAAWKKTKRDPSISSLRPLISLDNTEEDKIEQATSLSKIDNIRADPDREGRRVNEEVMVSDLYKRWVDGSGSVKSTPPGALACSQCQEEQCCCSCCQCECDRGEKRVSCGVCGGPMLVNVETTGGEGEALVTSSATTVVGDVSVVSCYRSVPSIPCLNSSNNAHVSNVHIVQSGGGEPVRPPPPPPPVQRTFTSTEAQTDDISVVQTSPSRCNNREQRRRERRERRHQRRLQNAGNNAPPHHDGHHHTSWQTQVMEVSPPPPAPAPGERLPDILNSHLPPPYSTLPLGMPPAPPPHLAPPPPPPPVPQPASPPPHNGMRFPFQITPAGRRRSRRSPRGQHYTPEEEPKSCCGVVVTQTVSIRWFIVMIAFVGICCAVVGTVLGAMKTSGREHLTVSLLMIGVGIVLITVSGVAWRLTAHDAPSCRMMLGLGGSDEGGSEPNRRFVPRLPPSYGRPHHPYAAMMYPEFQYRPPPPSYQASMQEYRLRLLLLDRHPGGNVPGPGHITSLQPVSPPPTYRSHSGSTLRAPIGSRRDLQQSEYSRPPSYRSRTSSTRPTMDPGGFTVADHSRDPSLSLSDSGGSSAVVNVINVGGVTESMDTVKMAPDPEQDIPLRMMLDKGSSSGIKDGNLVTIVQTGNDSSPVIVTVSGSAVATATLGGNSSQQQADPEMEILAHL